MAEDEFVSVALKAASAVLGAPLTIQRGAALLYEITVDNELAIRVDPRNPRRGQAAFQTDLCVFEERACASGGALDKVLLPRVVLEFKSSLSTHDVLTYSAKARRHKQVYPYLRYGLVTSKESTLPKRFYRHNEALDFAVAAATFKPETLYALFEQLLQAEVAASRELENLAFGDDGGKVFRNEPRIQRRGGAVA